MVVEYPAARGATAAVAATANRGVVRVAVVSAASRFLAQENILDCWRASTWFKSWMVGGVEVGERRRNDCQQRKGEARA